MVDTFRRGDASPSFCPLSDFTVPSSMMRGDSVLISMRGKRERQYIEFGASFRFWAGWFLVGANRLAAEPNVIKAARVIQCGAGPNERSGVTGVAITPDGRTIAAATDDHRVSIWDGTNGELKTELEAHADWVHSVVLSHDGSTVALGAADRTLCLWNMGKQKPEFQLPACKNAIAAVSMHPNNQQLAVVGFSGEIEIVNTSTGQASQKMDGPCVDIRTVAFSPNGGLMAAAGRNGKIRVWNIGDGHVQHEIATDGRRIRTLAFSPDSSRIAVAGDGKSVDIFDAATGEAIMKLPARPARFIRSSFSIANTWRPAVAITALPFGIWIARKPPRSSLVTRALLPRWPAMQREKFWFRVATIRH